MIYINGIKANKKDLETLDKWIKERGTKAKGHITKKGHLLIITSN